MSAIQYRITDQMDDMFQAEQLQSDAWGMSPSETLGAATMRWMVHIGGLLIGAWDVDRMIAFCVASVGKRDGRLVLWSDMAGVHPTYQGQNIGYTLKQHQRQWAKEQGYEEIRWTFDPMQRGNAHFNFRKLGVTSYHYHPEFYGEMKDSINRGLPADRLEAIWLIDSQPPPEAEDYENVPLAVAFIDNDIVVCQHEDNAVGIEIPYHLQKLKTENPLLARQWQSAVRSTFLNLFPKGYRIIDFYKSEAHAWYILHKFS